jgi:hypothetical protein
VLLSALNGGNNNGGCARSRITPPSRRPLFWIAKSIKKKTSARPALAFDAHSAVGRPARTTAGFVPAAMSGIRSIQEECARLAWALRYSGDTVLS